MIWVALRIVNDSIGAIKPNPSVNLDKGNPGLLHVSFVVRTAYGEIWADRFFSR